MTMTSRGCKLVPLPPSESGEEDGRLTIDLQHQQPLVIGRGPRFGISEKRCSKQHAELTADYDKATVEVKHLGANKSCVVGDGSRSDTLLQKDQTCTLRASAVFQLVESDLAYRVDFPGISPDPVVSVGEASTGLASVKAEGCELVPVTADNRDEDGRLAICLEHQKPLVVSRTPQFGITNKRCSNRHVELLADFWRGTVDVKQLGTNPSYVVGGKPAAALQKDQTATIRHSSVLQLLQGELAYRVVFKYRAKTKRSNSPGRDDAMPSAKRSNSPGRDDATPPAKRSNSPGREDPTPPAKRSNSPSREDPTPPAKHSNSPSRDDAMPPVKRSNSPGREDPTPPAKRSNSPGRDDAAPPAKRKKDLSEVLMRKAPVAVAVKTGQDAKRGPAAATSSWQRLPGVLVYNSAGLSASSLVASFDMDYTLIRTKSGKVFPTGSDDWKWWDARVVRKLTELNQLGFKIVVFSNQAGIGNSSTAAATYQKKVDDIRTALKVPFQLLASTGHGKYRKPMTGMWDHMVEKENSGIAVDISASFYVGDAAGRQANWSPGKKKDHSCADRGFSSNVKLTFHTPDEYFLGERPAPFKWSGFSPTSLDFNAPLCDEPGFKLASSGPELIVMVGFPGSGKSSFCEQHLVPLKYAHVSRDKEGTWQKCVSRVKQCLEDGGSAVVDNTSPDVESRGRYMQCARRAGVPARCFMMATSLEHAKHNNKVRMMSAPPGYKPPDHLAYNNYRSKYAFPTVGEGFTRVHMVNFVPSFQSKAEETQYMQILT